MTRALELLGSDGQHVRWLVNGVPAILNVFGGERGVEEGERRSAPPRRLWWCSPVSQWQW
eukprot:8957094-Prorocentrum_lima.AAC.1